jgi:hypothetical protein
MSEMKLTLILPQIIFVLEVKTSSGHLFVSEGERFLKIFEA